MGEPMVSWVSYGILGGSSPGWQLLSLQAGSSTTDLLSREKGKGKT